MTRTLRALLVEDSETDARLLVHELRRRFEQVDALRVDAAPEMRAALESADWDVILSDWSLPTFGGLQALELRALLAPEVPLLVVSGTIGEELAVEAMKRGATDYLLKDRLGRLVPAIERAVELRRARAEQHAQDQVRQAQLREVERALRESEQRFRALIEHGWDAIVLFDGDGNVVYIAPTTTRLLGHSSEELVGRPATSFVHPDDVELVGRAIAECASHTGTGVVVGRVRHKDGGYRVLEGRLTNLLDHPAVGAIVVNFRDVTDRNRAAVDLARSEARFRAYMAHTPMLATLRDAAGRLLFANAAWSRWYGSGRAVIGRTHAELWPEDIATRLSAEDRRVIDTQQVRESQMELAGEDGVGRLWQVVWFPVIDASGEVLVGALGLDITERIGAQAVLDAAQERLRRAVVAGNVGLWDWDFTTGQIYFSPEWKQQIGHAPGEIGSDVSEWASRVHPDDLDPARAAFDACLRGETGAYEREFRLRHRDGSYRHILARGTVARGDDGAPLRMLGSHVDVTARVELQAQLQHSQRMESLGQLAGGIAHDFNNLLAVINTTAELTVDALRPGDPLRDDLKEIHLAGLRGAALTRQLLTFSRRQVLSPVVLRLAPLVEGLKTMLGRLLGADIELVVTTRDEGSIKADPHQLEQVIVNLAVNARDAMPDGGLLTIETCDRDVDEGSTAQHTDLPAGRYVRFTVGDTGTGIDEATRSRMFEPFFTTKPDGRGTGLGLSTVHGIVRQSGGVIVVRTRLGEGTSFDVWLPRVEAAATPPREPRVAGPRDRVRDTVLFVEDEPALRRLAARLLQAAGYRALVASDGGEAVLMFERNPDIVLLVTDVLMPGISGPELAGRLRAQRPDLQVLFTSGYAGDEIGRLGLDDDSRTFLAKPYTSAALQEKVRALLDGLRPP